MKKIVIFILLMFLGLSILNSQETIENILNIYIIQNNIPIKINDNSLEIDKNIDINSFHNFLNFIFLNIDITVSNILNKDTAKTIEGGVYRRKYIKIIEGKIEIHEDNSNEIMLRWAPNHKDSYKSGPYEGYVEVPNVMLYMQIKDYIYEMKLLKEIINIGKSIKILNDTNYYELIVKQKDKLLLTMVSLNNNEETIRDLDLILTLLVVLSDGFL